MPIPFSTTFGTLPPAKARLKEDDVYLITASLFAAGNSGHFFGASYAGVTVVIPVFSGKNFAEIVEREKPDLILLDIMMPDMDGYQVCEKLKADEKTKNIPIIIFTADKDEAEKMMKIYKDIGAVDYVRKPFELRILLEKIDELINK